MHSNDSEGGIINRRAALALVGSAAVALKARVAQAQAAPLNPLQVLNGADARLFSTDIRSDLKLIAPNVYAFVQMQPPGWSNFNISNCGVVVGTDSLLAIDATATPIMAKNFFGAAQKATNKPVRRVVVTHFHGDHTGGLQFADAREIIAHEQCRAMMAKLVGQPKPANWAKRENWAEGTEDFKPAVPNLTYTDRLAIYDDNAPVELIHPGPAHTNGDTLVYLPRQKVIFLGDIGGFGVTPLNGSGYVAGLIKTCDSILGMDVETIVPGHGPVGGKAELTEMRDYFVLIQREGRKRFDAGMSAGQAAADIDLGRYKTWADADRIAINMARLYAEFAGTIKADQDFPAFIKAREEYTAIKGRR
jgi:cyclase